MKLNQLHDKADATKSRKRVGRGIGSGAGKTAGRGENGQKSRSGVALNGYEGGQMAIYRRLPKRGFKNPFSRNLNTVSVGRVQAAVDARKLDSEKTVTVQALVEAGALRRAKDGVRLLSDGEIRAKLTFEIAGASKAAIEKVAKAGGSVKVPEKADKASA